MKKFLNIIMYIIIFWIISSQLFFRFTHPEKTETEILLNTPYSLFFGFVDKGGSK